MTRFAVLTMLSLALMLSACVLPGRELSVVGGAAPEFTLNSLEGETVRLADHQGEEVVVLDFWATWCPPCVKGLPAIEELASKYEGKDVVVYAVNQAETPEQIKAFLEEHGLELNVLLDEEQSVAQAYGVTGIPTTVVIDKAGTVKAAYVGLAPNLESKLSSNVDAALTAK